MGRRSRRLWCLALGLALAGCAPAPRPPVAVPQARPSNGANTQAASTDPKIVDKVAAALNGLDAQAFHAVSMAESGGAVLLVGAVVRPDQRRQLEKKVAAVPGVTGVTDRIQVIDGAALDSYQPDLGKERDLAARLSSGLAVRVVHGVAYLVGAAGPGDLAAFKESVADDSAIQWVDDGAVTVR